ncbi:hypothetical protein CMK19_07300 [Candidatus Poribacteria bacterium]|nr:hypothetical protein [Candidatus Poribacteria bacterium]
MQFEKIVGEDQLIELYGDRVESSGNDFVGGLAWIGTERVMWAEWESDQISIGSIRRLERLFKLASHSGRPFFLTTDLVQQLRYQAEQSSLSVKIAIQSWMECVVDYSSAIVVVTRNKKEPLDRYADMIADYTVSSTAESLEIIKKLDKVTKDVLKRERKQRILGLSLNQKKDYSSQE